jgi:TfoX/Sxy family transcriptional regulator of competence genes
MPYDENLAQRIRPMLARRKGFAEKKMFGGIGYLLNGNMCCGVWKKFLIVRVGPEGYAKALGTPFTRKFDITGRAMRGWVMVEPEGLQSDADLEDWVARAARYAGSLPGKPPPAARPRRR